MPLPVANTVKNNLKWHVLKLFIYLLNRKKKLYLSRKNLSGIGPVIIPYMVVQYDLLPYMVLLQGHCS